MRIMSLDIGKICRTCLALTGPLLSIFDNSAGGSGCLADMLKDLTKMKPMPGDKMPENVCLTCISEINRCYSFKMKCQNSNKTLHQLIPEAIVEEESTSEIQKKKVRQSTKGIQTTPEKKKKFATAQAQTIAEEKVQVCHQQVQTELHNSDKATSPVTDKFASQEKVLQSKTEQASPEEPQEHMDDLADNSKQRITRSIARLANKKQTDAEKVIAFKRLTIDSEDQIPEEVIYELQSENGQDITSFDGLDDADNQLEADEVSAIDQTAYYVLSDSQGGEDIVNYDIAYDSDNYEEEIVDGENVNMQQQQIIKDDYNFTIINPGEEGEEQIAPVAATTSRNSLAIKKASKSLPHLDTVKKCEFNCPDCPMEFVSVNNLKRHCLKIHDWSLDEIKVLDGARLNITEKKPSKRKTLLKYDEYIGDVTLPPEVEAAIVQKLEVERYQQTQKGNSSLPMETAPKNKSLSSTAASTGGMNFFCPHCNACFVLRKSLSMHMKQNQCSIKSYECPECNRVFTSEESLEEHQKTHVLEFTCAECNLVYNNNGELSQHLIDAHNRNPKNQCGICKKVFTMLSALKDHLRIHSGEKPFVCPTCGKAFRQNTNLKQHLMRHSNIKPFQCSECPLSFVSKAELISHNHVHVGGHPYKCEMCDARYTTSSSLVKHMRKHTGERPYACEYCPRRFSVLNVLKNHRRIHTGEKPFQCIYCQKAFTQKSDCQTHQRTHTGEKPYVCHCNAAFTHLSTLRMHMKLHAKELNDTNWTKRKRRSATTSDDAFPNQIKKLRILNTKPKNQDENDEPQQENDNVALVAVTSEDDLIEMAITDVC